MYQSQNKVGISLDGLVNIPVNTATLLNAAADLDSAITGLGAQAFPRGMKVPKPPLYIDKFIKGSF